MKRWNIEYLKELYNKYSKLAVETSDPTLSLEYENVANSVFVIIDRYDELIHNRINYDSCVERVNYRNVIENDFWILDNYGIYCPIIRNLSEYNERLCVRPNEVLSTIDTSVSKILTVSRDFYDSIGGVFNDKYKMMSRRFKDTLHISKLGAKEVNNGQTYSVYSTDITFIEIGANQTAQDYISAIHEFGHGISCSINPTGMFDFGKYCFIELDSLFFEILGLDFLDDKLKLHKDSLDIRMQVLKDYLYSAQLICIKLDMYNDLNSNQLYKKRIINKYLTNEAGLNKIGIDDVLNTHMRDYFHYIISYLTAIELYFIYQADKNIALDLLFNIISKNAQYSIDYLNYVRSLGLEPGKNFEKYIELLHDKAKDLKDENSLRYKN